MHRGFVWGCLLFFAGATSAIAEEWKPAAGPLLSRFASDVRPDKVWSEYPRPQMVRRQWQNLNGLWQFAVASRDAAPPVGKNLPQQILVPFPVESALSGVMRSAERVWYRRTFAIPQAWAGKHVLLHFGAVDWDTTVWVNGKKIGTHRGGYDPFEFDIAGALTPSGEQELIVGVYDPTDAGNQPRGKQVRSPHSIWYTSTTGIWQTVWLEPVADEHVTSLRIAPDLKAGVVRVTVQGSSAADGLPVRLTALSGDEPVASGTGSLGQTIELPILDAHPWSPADPFLYGLKVVIGDVERATDSLDSYFGMRDISIGKGAAGTTRLLLNGTALFQYGPLDQGFWPDGLYTAPSDAAQRYDLEVTKKLGFNMARKHVKVEPERWYYWCDKLGLLVWQDMPSGDRSVATGQGRAEADDGFGPAIRIRADAHDRDAHQPSLDRDVGRVQRRLGAVRHRPADATTSKRSIPRAWSAAPAAGTTCKSATCTTFTSIRGRPRHRSKIIARPCWASSAASACRSSATPGKTKRTGAIATCRPKKN